MKCVVTGQETNTLTKGIPLSREGRTLLSDITSRYNEKIKQRFVKSFIEKSNNSDALTIEAVEELSPKFTNKDLLKMLVKNTEEDLFKPFEEKEEAVEEVEESEVEA